MASEDTPGPLGNGVPAAAVEPISLARGRKPRPAAAFRMAPEAAQPVHTAGQLEEQLRKRLRVESIIWALATGGVALVALTVRPDLYADPVTMFTSPPMPGVLALIALATFVVARVLRPNRALGLARLRMLEWGGVVVTAAFLIIDEAIDLRTMAAVLDVKPLDLALGLGAPWGALIVAYGVLIPSNLRHAFIRTAVLVGCAFLPELIAFPVMGFVPGAGMYIAIKCLTVVTFAALALYGSYHIDELHEDVRSARQLGHYVLVRALGQGGMGSVYLAEHNFLRRPCAVKLIRPELARDDAAHARFEREVQAAAALTHPNTVQIYDYGKAEDGTLYYAMEYLPGESLETLVGRDGPFDPVRAVRILEQLCGALGEAHARGLVHRDVKPGNIMLCDRGGIPEVVKLLDFGSVAAVQAGPEDPRITRAGMIVGTPSFMSPEQCRGDETLTPLSDIYSVGAVAFFLLTGKEPFYRKLTAMEVMAAQIYEFPPSIRDLRPDVPIELAAVVEKCLAKDPFERIATAPRLARALGAAVSGSHPEAVLS